jgi:hypothetical protein
MPGLGNTVTRERDGVNCNNVAASTSAIATTATYNLSYTGVICELEFKKCGEYYI